MNSENISQPGGQTGNQQPNIVYVQVPTEASAAPLGQPMIDQARELAKTNAVEECHKTSRRLKWSSNVIGLFALGGMGCALYHGFSARKMAEKIVTQPGAEQSEYISKDEFDLYDTFKGLALITFFFSCCLMKIAIKGRMGGFYS